MKPIRIKVKTILILVVIVVLLAVSVYSFSDNAIYLLGLIYDKVENDEVASAYYKRVVDKFPNREGAITASIKQIENILEQNNLKYFEDKIIIDGGGMTTSGNRVSNRSLENINNDYEKMLKNQEKSDSLGRYAIGVAILNWFGGEHRRAIGLLEEIIYIENEDLEEVRKLNLAAMNMSIGEIDKGQRIIEKDINKADPYRYFRQDLLSYSYFMEQDFENFRSNLSDRSLRYINNKKIKEPFIKTLEFVGDITENYERLIESREGRTQTDNVIKGRATINEEPLAYALVFAKNKENRYYSSSYLDEGTGIMAIDITDNNGWFEIENIPNGTYGIGISVDWARINGKQVDMNKEFDIELAGRNEISCDISFFEPMKVRVRSLKDENKLEFTWDSVDKDVAYYSLSLGEIREDDAMRQIVNFGYSSGRIFGESFVLDIEKERKQAFGGFMSWGPEGIEPYYTIGPLYHTGDYAYKITGYSENGNIITDSIGIYSSIDYDKVFIKGEEWTKADKLLLDRKYDEAVLEYEKAIERDPDDVHAMKTLAKLYYYGWEYDEDSQELKNKDWNKAKEYLEFLDKVLGYNGTIKYYLTDIYKWEKNYQKALDIYKSMVANGDSYIYRNIGDIYLYMGDRESAVRYYDMYYEKTKRDDTIAKILMIYILEDRQENLEEVAKKFNGDYFTADLVGLIKRYKNEVSTKGYVEFHDMIKHGDLENAKKYIENKEDALSRFYKGILILEENIERKDKEKRYTEEYNYIGSQPLKGLMKAFGKASLNTGFGDR